MLIAVEVLVPLRLFAFLSVAVHRLPIWIFQKFRLEETIWHLIKEIQIYPNGESEQLLKSIEFNFPIYRDGQEVRRLLWEKGNTVECVVSMSRKETLGIQ